MVHAGNDLESDQTARRRFRSHHWMEPEQSILWNWNKSFYCASGLHCSEWDDRANMEDSDEQGAELHAWDCFECFRHDPYRECHAKHRQWQCWFVADRHGILDADRS